MATVTGILEPLLGGQHTFVAAYIFGGQFFAQLVFSGQLIIRSQVPAIFAAPFKFGNSLQPVHIQVLHRGSMLCGEDLEYLPNV
jgi:hypothetical protein